MTADFKGKRIVPVSSDEIDAWLDTLTPLFLELLDMEPGSFLVTDESRLSDFSSCGLPEYLTTETSSLQEVYAAWDAWVLGELETRYGVKLNTTAIRLIDLASALEEAGKERKPTLH